MFNRVYGENLAEADLSKTTTGTLPVEVGGTQGALVINVFADGGATTAEVSSVGVKVSIVASDTPDGTFTEVASMVLPVGSFDDEELIATISLPHDVKTYAKAIVTGNASSTGNVIVTPGYLAR